MHAKSVDEIERIMKFYRKRRNSTVKKVFLAIGVAATISVANYITEIKTNIADLEMREEILRKANRAK